MKNSLFIAVRVFVVTFVVLGLAYPLAITGIAQLAMRDKASGSMVRDASGTTVGSALIGQQFVAEDYFHPRPSATDYAPLGAVGSNLGPTSKKLANQLAERAAALDYHSAIPADALTGSGSAIDPHISPANAYRQVPRVARARQLAPAAVRALVARHIEQRDLGFIGEPRVNVLSLNLSLDAATTP